MQRQKFTVCIVWVEEPRHAGPSLSPAGVFQVVATSVSGSERATGITRLIFWWAHLRDAGYFLIDILQSSNHPLEPIRIRKAASMLKMVSLVNLEKSVSKVQKQVIYQTFRNSAIFPPNAPLSLALCGMSSVKTCGCIGRAHCQCVRVACACGGSVCVTACKRDYVFISLYKFVHAFLLYFARICLFVRPP